MCECFSALFIALPSFAKLSHNLLLKRFKAYIFSALIRNDELCLVLEVD